MITIKTPNSEMIQNNLTPKGGAKTTLNWDNSFGDKWSGQYNQAQKFIDSEVLRKSEPFTPLLTGQLIKSGQLHTDIGSGKVTWGAIYAKRRYYGKSKIGSQTGALRGSYWFERMKAAHGKAIIQGAAKIATGGGT